MVFPDGGPLIDDANKSKRDGALAIVVFVLFLAASSLVGVHLFFEAIAPDDQVEETWQN